MSVEDEYSAGLEVAVVGMAGRFPGAVTVEEFWRGVAEGREVISHFTQDELAAEGVPEELRRRPDYVPAYGVLSDVERFDAGFFGYSPRDASLIDPQQRLFLECAWEALEGAGHLVPAPGELVGVYAGASMSSYLLHHLLGNSSLPASVSEYELLLANDKDSLAPRVAYHLDLQGPAVTVQTACSSSLVAVHLASQALLARECDVAIAGGVHVRLPMRSGYRYEVGGIMSRDGRCRPFEAAATGTVGGNGVAAVVLRRLDDAVRDSDTIYAVVKGSAINNDGAVKVGFTAPSIDGQAAVIRMAQEAADVAPDSIGYVETHGTATSLGDQIEFEALVQAFRERTDATGYCALGAVKSLVGHLDAAAGVAGFVKAVLALHHGVIPPSPYFTDPNPALDFAASPFLVNAAPAAWPDLGGPRRAAVSSFGIGGTNAHVVLEEAPAPQVQESARAAQLLVLSAKSPTALADMRARLAAYLRERPDVPLADVAATLQATRRTFLHRLALVCRDRPDAVAGLAGNAPTAVRTQVEQQTDGTVAFLFPGQGTQHVDMGLELYRTEPAFRSSFDDCADLLRPHLDLDLREVLYPATGGEAAAASMRQTGLTQPALFAVEYALAALWAEWGVRPAAMLGHSIGEYVAACLAGVFSLADALATVAVRGRLMQAMPPGAMLSVPLPAAEVEALLAGGAALAAANGPRLSVAAGDAVAIEALEQTLRLRQVECRRLHTSHAFHSPMMSPVLAPFTEQLRRMTLSPPRIPVVSNVTGSWLTPEEATDPGYWARHLRYPVRFSAGAELLAAQGHAMLEVGPGTTLATLVRQHQAAAGRTVASSLSSPARPRPDGAAMADALGRLWLAGIPVDWHGVWAHERRRRVALPTYPFQREPHWVDRPLATAGERVEATATTDLPDVPVVDATPVRDTIRRIWVDLLGVPDVGDHDDFFELGGHSLLGTQVVARIQDALRVDLPPGALFESPTIATLATVVEDLLPDSGTFEERRAAGNAEEAAVMSDLLAEILALSPEELRDQLAREQHA